MDSPLLEKAIDPATQIILFYEEFEKSKRDTTIAKQLLRSAASIGANINEAVYGNSKADFIATLHIALKEAAETECWLHIPEKSKYLDENMAVSMLNDCLEIKRIPVASNSTAKAERERNNK